MSTPSKENETELRDSIQMWVELAVHKFNASNGVVIMGECSEESVKEIMALITSDKQRLLEGLMEQKQKYHKQTSGKPYATNGFKGMSNIYYESGHEAIPLSVIQNKLEGLS